MGLIVAVAGCGGSPTPGVSSPSPAHAVFGLDFEPYTEPGQSPFAGPVPDTQVQRLLDVLRGKTRWIKTSGSSAGQERIPCMAHAAGFHVAAVAFLNGGTDDPAELTRLEANVERGCVEVAVVGNEAAWHQYYSGAEVAARVNQVRCETTPAGRPSCSGRPGVQYGTEEPDELNRAGSPGKRYGPADVAVEMGASDVFLANIPSFNYGDTQEQAMADVEARYGAISAAAQTNTRSHSRAWIGESEWPSGCDVLGDAKACKDPRAAVSSAAAYFVAFEAWVRSSGTSAFYYEAVDNSWAAKYDQGYGNHWGVFDPAGTLKPGFAPGFP